MRCLYIRAMPYLYNTLISPLINFGNKVSRKAVRVRIWVWLDLILLNIGSVSLLKVFIVNSSGINISISFIIAELIAVTIEEVLPKVSYLYVLRNR
jgi:hypothetical protein